MAKKIILGLILLAIAIAAAWFSQFSKGTVVVYLPHYRLSAGLNLLIIAWIGSICLLYLIYNLIKQFFAILPQMINYFATRRQRAANRLLNQTAIEYFSGNYSKSYQFALWAINKEPHLRKRLIPWLLAYYSAVAIKDESKLVLADNGLQQVAASDRKLVKGLKLIQYLAMADTYRHLAQYTKAVDSLQTALELDKKNISVHEALLKVYSDLGNFPKAYEHLKYLVKLKSKDVAFTELNRYLVLISGGLLAASATIWALVDVYHEIKQVFPDNYSGEIYNKLYFENLLRLHEYQSAIEFLEEHFSNEGMQLAYIDYVFMLAKRLETDNLLQRLLTLASEALIMNPANPELILALAIICYKLHLGDKLRRYVQACDLSNLDSDARLILKFLQIYVN